jgi:hypothetical protein
MGQRDNWIHKELVCISLGLFVRVSLLLYVLFKRLALQSIDRNIYIYIYIYIYCIYYIYKQ